MPLQQKYLNMQRCNMGYDCKNANATHYCSAMLINEKAAKKRPEDGFSCDSEQSREYFATRCDGNPECEYRAYEEECTDCIEGYTFCKYFKPTTNEDNATMFQCESGSLRIEFDDGSLEGFQICDGIANCAGHEDERNCSRRTAKTDLTRPTARTFYCEDGGSNKYLDMHKVCDGNQDCKDGLDECQPQCIESVFSDEKSMIKSKVIRSAVWLLGIIAITGNMAVVVVTALNLLKLKSKLSPPIETIHTILILNLSLSDLLVGIYIISICGKTLQVEGEYCLVDRAWRSSGACAALGALLVIGSEESVLTMILITLIRMKAIFRPLLRNINLIWLWGTLAITWIISTAIAVCPVISSLEDYFVDTVWIAGSPIFTTVRKRDVGELVSWIAFYMNHSVPNRTGRATRLILANRSDHHYDQQRIESISVFRDSGHNMQKDENFSETD